MSSILNEIRKAYPELAPSKKRVASYFMNNYASLFMDTVTELSQKIGVSDTTVINLCNDLGFQGYSGFRKAVKKEVLSANEEPAESKESSAEAGEIVEYLIDGIRRTFDSRENLNSIDKAVDFLGNAGKIYCVGFWTLSGTAKSMALRLSRAGYRAEAVYPDMGGFIDQIRWSKEGNAAIVYDCMRYITSLTEICSIFREHGVKIILITDNGPCPRISMADAVIHCEQGKSREYGWTDSHTQISIVDQVIYKMLTDRYPRQEDGYDNKIREGVFTRFNPYGVIEPDSGKKAPEF